MKRSVQILWRIFLGGFGLLVLMLLCANFGLFGKMPSVEELQNPEADLASEIYSSDGVLMGKYYSENRSEVKYNEISPNVINALIATEDERFMTIPVLMHRHSPGWFLRWEHRVVVVH